MFRSFANPWRPKTGRKRVRPALEVLESRVVPAVFSTARSGLWFDPDTWRDSDGNPGVPSAGDTAIIRDSASVSAAGVVVVDSIVLRGYLELDGLTVDTMAVHGSSVLIHGPLHVTQELALSSVTVVPNEPEVPFLVHSTIQAWGGGNLAEISGTGHVSLASPLTAEDPPQPIAKTYSLGASDFGGSLLVHNFTTLHVAGAIRVPELTTGFGATIRGAPTLTAQSIALSSVTLDGSTLESTSELRIGVTGFPGMPPRSLEMLNGAKIRNQGLWSDGDGLVIDIVGGSGEIINEGTIGFHGSFPGRIGARLVNHGTVNLQSAHAYAFTGGGSSDAGGFHFGTGAESTATVFFVGNFTFTNTAITGGIGPGGAATAQLVFDDGASTFSGSIQFGGLTYLGWEAATFHGPSTTAPTSLFIDGAPLFTGPVILSNGALGASGEMLFQDRLWGDGTLQGNVLNHGTIDPMRYIDPTGATQEPRTIRILGNYTQGANGTLHIDFFDPLPGDRERSDRLVVSGAVTLGGVLDVSNPVNAADPGERFTVLTYQSRTGHFASTQGLQEAGAGGGVLHLLPDYRDGDLVLSRPVPVANNLAFHVLIDYGFDDALFRGNPAQRAAFEAALRDFIDRIRIGGPADNLAAIIPGAGQNWTGAISNPATGEAAHFHDLIVPANTYILFVGSREHVGSSGDALGEASRAAAHPVGDSAWHDRVVARGQLGALDPAPTDFGPWGGYIAFNSNAPQSFHPDDFYSTAVHELAHAFGFGTAPSWHASALGEFFRGPSAHASFGDDVPIGLGDDEAHWHASVFTDGYPTAMAPGQVYAAGHRYPLAPLDYAALRDIGWNVDRFVDLRPTQLNLSQDRPAVEFRFVSDNAPAPLGALAKLYWAMDNAFDTRIGESIFTYATDESVQNFGPIEVRLSELGPKPAEARFLLLVLDPLKQVLEEIEGNNVLSLPFGTPDLVPLDLDLDDDIVHIAYEVKFGPVSEATTVNVYAASGPSTAAIIAELFSLDLDGRVGVHDIPVQVPDEPFLPAGTTHVLVVVDPLNLTLETDETNNVRAVRLPVIAVQAQPVNVLEGTTVSGVQAAFTDEADETAAADYQATIHWGDGTTSTATAANGMLVATGPNSYEVRGAHRYGDGPIAGPRTVIVSDRYGRVGRDDADAVVVNVAPTAKFAATTPVRAGQTCVVSFTNRLDPSAADVAAAFRYSFDFDSNGTFEIVNSATPSASVPSSFLSPRLGTRVVRGRIADKDGGSTDYTFTVRVLGAVVYVNRAWAGKPNGADPDGAAGPAVAMGSDAFATLAAGIAGAPAGGIVEVYAGSYSETVDLTAKRLTLRVRGADAVSVSAVAGNAATAIELGGGRLTVGDHRSLAFAGAIRGTGHLAKTGTGTWTLTGSRQHTGGTTVAAGTLSLGTPSAPVGASTGLITVGKAGILATAADFQLNQATLLVQGGRVIVRGGAGRLIIGATGALRGQGQVQGNVVNSGVVNPGTPGAVTDTAAGTMVVTGTFVQNPTGILKFDLGSVAVSDKLVVQGAAQLGGTLATGLLPNYVGPAAGARFEVMTFAARLPAGQPALPSNFITKQLQPRANVALEARLGASGSLLNPSTNATTLTLVSFAAAAVDVTSRVSITRSGVTSASATLFAQTLTIRNVSATPIAGPMFVVVDPEPGRPVPQLWNRQGFTALVPPAGRQYLLVRLGTLAPGASATVQLQWHAPTHPASAILYRTRVVASGAV